MRNFVVVAETGADIPQELAERYRIHIVPMHVSFGNVTKDDGTFPAEEICRYYESTGELPKTSGSVPEDFIKAYDVIHSQNPEAHILYLAYSSVTTVSDCLEGPRLCDLCRHQVSLCRAVRHCGDHGAALGGTSGVGYGHSGVRRKRTDSAGENGVYPQ